ncbi:MAG: tetratricopeptide repeat protein [Acidobacteriota bacterium]
MSVQSTQEQVFVVDDELVERLLRGDAPKPGVKSAQHPQARPAAASSLAKALQLATAHNLDEAVKELSAAALRGEDSAEVYSALGHLRFEQEQWSQAADCYAKVTALDAAAAGSQHKAAPYNLALALERQGKYSDAALAFEAATDRDSKLWQAWTGRGLCLLRTGKADAALSCFDRALTIDPAHERTLFGRAVALHKLGRLDEAAELYRKLLPGNANAEELLANLVSLSIARKEDQKTKEFADRLLKVRPQSRSALEALALLALNRGDYSAAIQQCSQLVKLTAEPGSDHYAAWFQLATAQQKSGRADLAANAYKEAIRIRPNQSEGHVNLGAMLEERGDKAGARQAYEKALAIQSDLPGALWNLAIVLEKDGQLEKAEKRLQQLVAAKPDWEDAAYRLGFLQLQRGDYASAVDSFETCLKHRPDWVEALLNLGLACWKFEDLETAAATFEHVLQLESHNTDALRALTAIAIERKDHKAAWEYFKKLTSTGAKSFELAYNLGLLLQNSHEPAMAVDAYRQAAEQQPSFAPAWINLGHALKTQGKQQEAAQVWSKAVDADPALAAKFFQ